MPPNSHHPLAYLRLARLRGVGPVLIKRLLQSLGSAEAILTAHPSTLAAVEGIGTIKANQIVTSAAATEKDALEELTRIKNENITLLTPLDHLYPPGLKTIHDPPLVLYVRGTLQPNDAIAIGIVGARECTLYGREQSTRLATQLATAGLTIVSGGARGIDTCAHLGALRANGRTIVVQGCGHYHTYPPENADLYKRIENENAGAILSEFPLDTPPNRENFPPRNRIIAGMSLGILVVEANLRSGSLITARLAADDYGREVFALPGRVDSPASAGTHHLIKNMTAHLVESAEDVLNHLGDVGSLLKKTLQQNPAASPAAPHTPASKKPPALFQPISENPPAPAIPFTTTQQKLLGALTTSTPKTIDDLIDATALPPQIIMADLTLLELRNHIARAPANRFLKK